jgi:hypothetical protein
LADVVISGSRVIPLSRRSGIAGRGKSAEPDTLSQAVDRIDRQWFQDDGL